jgi:hypothetical protein
MHHSALGNTSANEGGSLALGMEHGRNRVPAALADDHNDLALAALILSEAAIKALLFAIGGLDVAAEISAINFGLLPSPPTMRAFAP